MIHTVRWELEEFFFLTLKFSELSTFGSAYKRKEINSKFHCSYLCIGGGIFFSLGFLCVFIFHFHSQNFSKKLLGENFFVLQVCR